MSEVIKAEEGLVYFRGKLVQYSSLNTEQRASLVKTGEIKTEPKKITSAMKNKNILDEFFHNDQVGEMKPIPVLKERLRAVKK